MAQVLIVEGNDGIALAAICQKRGLPPPKGYENKAAFKRDFVIQAGGIDRALRILSKSLENSEISRIGIIVDADQRGAVVLLQGAFLRILSEAGFSQSALLKGMAPLQGPWIIREADMPTVGIWIMPDNQNPGYLEHFLAVLTPEADPLLQAVDESIEQLRQGGIQKFSDTKTGKARLHTWLAWQETPGQPFGTAVQSGYFDLTHPLVDTYIHWFETVFELSS